MATVYQAIDALFTKLDYELILMPRTKLTRTEDTLFDLQLSPASQCLVQFPSPVTTKNVLNVEYHLEDMQVKTPTKNPIKKIPKWLKMTK